MGLQDVTDDRKNKLPDRQVVYVAVVADVVIAPSVSAPIHRWARPILAHSVTGRGHVGAADAATE